MTGEQVKYYRKKQRGALGNADLLFVSAQQNRSENNPTCDSRSMQCILSANLNIPELQADTRLQLLNMMLIWQTHTQKEYMTNFRLDIFRINK